MSYRRPFTATATLSNYRNPSLSSFLPAAEVSGSPRIHHSCSSPVFTLLPWDRQTLRAEYSVSAHVLSLHKSLDTHPARLRCLPPRSLRAPVSNLQVSHHRSRRPQALPYRSSQATMHKIARMYRSGRTESRSRKFNRSLDNSHFYDSLGLYL